MHTDLSLRHRFRILAAAGLLVLASPVLAQTGSAAGGPGAEQLRALIYYLDHDDQRSVQAEMRRLRAQYPGWTPPGDLNDLRAQVQVGGPAVDVAPIWTRIERGDHGGARRLIEQTRTATPDWTPDAEMLRLVEMGEAQAALDAAYAARDPAGVIAAARQMPAIMRCDRINNAWRLAEMYQAADQRATAVETYRGVVGACAQRTDAVATLEKANEIATWPEMEQLFVAARRVGPGNAAALDALEARLRAGRGQPAAAPVQQAGGSAPPASAQATSAAAPAAPATAAATASTTAPAAGPVNLSGLPVTGDNRLAAVRRHKEAGRWAECAAASVSPRSIELLYERSWCVYNLERPGEALAGFIAAERTGNRLGPNVNRDARFGMVLSYLAMNMTEAGAGLSASTALTTEQRVEVEATILDQRGVRAFQGRDHAGSIRYFNALEQLTGTLRRDLAMMRGYAYLNDGQTELAFDQFSRLHAQLATDETRAALRATQSRLGG